MMLIAAAWCVIGSLRDVSKSLDPPRPKRVIVNKHRQAHSQSCLTTAIFHCT